MKNISIFTLKCSVLYCIDIFRKYEEIYPPDVGEFVYITDDTYTKKQVLRMEHLILRVLSFDLTVPTPLTFLTEYCIGNNLSEKVKFLAMVNKSSFISSTLKYYNVSLNFDVEFCSIYANCRCSKEIDLLLCLSLNG